MNSDYVNKSNKINMLLRFKTVFSTLNSVQHTGAGS